MLVYDMRLVVIGFAMVILLIAALLSGKTIPAVAFVLIAIPGAILLGYGPSEISGFVKDGVSTVINSVCLAMFATAYFTIITSMGIFDPLVKFLSKYTSNVAVIMVITYAIATVGHLDTGTTSTILLTIPMMLPLYRRFHIRVEYMFLTIGMAVAVMNLLPMAGGHTGLSAVTGIDIGAMFNKVVPSMIIGWFVNLVSIFVYAKFESRRIAKMTDEEKAAQDAEYAQLMDAGQDKAVKLMEVKMDLKYWINVVVLIAALVFVFMDIVVAYLVFLIAYMLTLVINFPSNKEKLDMIKRCSANCYPIALIMLTAGVFVGVMNGSGVLENMAAFVVSLIPTSLHGVYNIMMLIVSVPMSIALGSQAFYYGFCPLLLEVGTSIGVPIMSTITTLQLTQNAFGFITPVSAVNHLACGMLGRDIKDVIKFCFPRLLLYLVIQFAISCILGFIPIGG